MNRNPHWLPGETSADHARRRGWTVGTRLISHGDSGSTTITITAIGRENILALPDDNRSEGAWTLQCRDWQLETPEQETTMTTETFTATNGLTFTFPEDGSIRWEAGHPPRLVTEALREYFIAERDTELGRWRDEEKPNMVVYRVPENDDKDGRAVRVIDEATGAYFSLWERDVKHFERGSVHATAARYFAAHPEPRPWHSAQPGEVWLLTINDEQTPA